MKYAARNFQLSLKKNLPYLAAYLNILLGLIKAILIKVNNLTPSPPSSHKENLLHECHNCLNILIKLKILIQYEENNLQLKQISKFIQKTYFLFTFTDFVKRVKHKKRIIWKIYLKIKYTNFSAMISANNVINTFTSQLIVVITKIIEKNEKFVCQLHTFELKDSRIVCFFFLRGLKKSCAQFEHYFLVSVLTKLI